MAIPSELPFRHHSFEIFVHSKCILDSVVNLLVRHMVFVGTVQRSPKASNLDPALQFCCQCAGLTGVKECG